MPTLDSVREAPASEIAAISQPAEVHALGHLSGRERMVLLCNSFPCLRGKPGTKPWNEEAFAHWASAPISHGEQLAATFILSVWSGDVLDEGHHWNSGEFHVGRFDAVEAIRTWSDAERDAFTEWCRSPFYP
jgi:hypothetical protein